MLRQPQDWWSTETGIVALATTGLPVAILVAAALALARGSWRRSVAEVGMLYGTVPMVWLTMLPGSGAGVVPGRLSLVPLRDLATMDDLQIVGNLLLLAAIGLFAPVRWAVLASPWRMLLLGAAGSTLIETLQYALRLDRVSSVDDVLLNATGAMLAACASSPWWARPTEPRSRGSARSLARRTAARAQLTEQLPLRNRPTSVTQSPDA